MKFKVIAMIIGILIAVVIALSGVLILIGPEVEYKVFKACCAFFLSLATIVMSIIAVKKFGNL